MMNIKKTLSFTVSFLAVTALQSYATPVALVHRWPFDINYSEETKSNHSKAYNDVITGNAPIHRFGVCSGNTKTLETVPGKLVLNGNKTWGGGSLAIWGTLGLTDATFEIWTSNDDYVKGAVMITYSDTQFNNVYPENEFCIQWGDGGTSGSVGGLWAKSGKTDRLKQSGAFSPYTMKKEYYYAVTFHAKDDGSTDITWQRRDSETGRMEKSGSGNAPNWTLGSVVNSATLNLGVYKQSGYGDAKCTFNEVRVWNGVLSAEQMAANACMGPDVIADSSVVGAGASGFALAPGAVFSVYEDFTTAGTVTLGQGSKIRFHSSAVFTAAGFVLPSGTLEDYVDVDRERFSVEISGNVISVVNRANVAVSASWTGNGAAGDVTDAANWNCVDLYGNPIVAVPSLDTDVTIAGTGLNLCAPKSAPLDAKSITLGACTLGADLDWRGFSVAPSLASGSINLNGYRLYLSSLSDEDSNKLSGTGELHFDLPSGRSVSFSSIYFKDYKLFKYGEGDLNLRVNMSVGNDGTTSFVHGGGTATVGGFVVLGYYNKAPGRGIMTVTNGTVTVKDSIHMGYPEGQDAYGTLNVGPGGVVNVNFDGKKLLINNKNSILNVYDGGKVLGNVRNNITDGVFTYSSSGGTFEGTFENNGRMVIKDCTTAMSNIKNLSGKTLAITNVTFSSAFILNNKGGTVITGGNNELYNIEIDGNGSFSAGGTTVLRGYLSIGHSSNNSGSCTVVGSSLSVANTLYVGFNGTGRLDVGSGGNVTATPALGLEVRRGELSVHDGGVINVRQLVRTGSGSVAVKFDGGVLKPTFDTTGTYATEFIKSLNDLNINADGMAIQTTGKNLGMKDCTLKFVPAGKITITGAGKFSFSNTTFTLSEKPAGGRYVFAETDGTFEGVPTFNDTFKTGRKLALSSDGRRICLEPRSFSVVIR